MAIKIEEKHSDICYSPCPNCTDGKLENAESCSQCGGTACLDRNACKEIGNGLGCNM